MEQDVIVLYAQSFERTNDNGQKVTGIAIWYYPSATLRPIFHKEDKIYGLMPCKAVIDTSKLVKLEKVPGRYRFRFFNVPSGAEGVRCKLIDMSYISELDDIDVFKSDLLNPALDEERLVNSILKR